MNEEETFATRSRREAEERLEAAAAQDPESESDPKQLAASEVSTRDVRKEIAVAVAVMVIGVGLVLYAGSIREGSIPDPITSSGLPRLTGILLIVFGAIATVQNAMFLRRGQRRIASTGGDDEPGFDSSAGRAFAFLAGAAVWAYMVDRVGYFIATPIALAAALAAMGIRTWGKLILIPLVFTAVAWLMFYEVLGIQLPLGFLESTMRDLGVIA